jgi:hypothetical protein
MAEEIQALLLGDSTQDGADSSPEAWNCALGGLAQECFELAVNLFDRIEVLRSGEYAGRKMAIASAAWIAFITPPTLWVGRLSMMTMSPRSSVGGKHCSTKARNVLPFIGPAVTTRRIMTPRSTRINWLNLSQQKVTIGGGRDPICVRFRVGESLAWRLQGRGHCSERFHSRFDWALTLAAAIGAPPGGIALHHPGTRPIGTEARSPDARFRLKAFELVNKKADAPQPEIIVP